MEQFIEFTEGHCAASRVVVHLDMMVTLVLDDPTKGAAMTEDLENIQDRNLSIVFNVLDANQDGKITAEDFDLFARTVCEQFGIAMDSDNGRKIYGAYQAWWNQLQQNIDTENDGQVTPAEFAAIHEGDQADPQKLFSEQLGQAARLLGEAIDTDQDGYITQAEYLTFLALVITDQQAALAGFQQLDTDGDGRISMDEFQAGIQQGLLSNDPSAPGTSLLGQR